MLIKSLISLLLFVVPLQSKAGTADRSFPSLAELDRVVRDAELYDGRRLHRIDSCRSLLGGVLSDERRYEVLNGMRGLYDKFQTDSAASYAGRSLSLAEKMGRKKLVNLSLTALAKEYATSGLYYETLDLLDSVDRSTASADCLVDMYYLYYFAYGSLSSLSPDSALASLYDSKALTARDSILLWRPDYAVFKCGRLLAEGNVGAAMEVILPVCDSLDVRDTRMGPAALAAAELYESLGLRETAKSYLIMSAMSDLVNAKKEYVALRTLAVMLYEDGDIRRAHEYLTRSLDDAVFCKARLKVDAIAPMISIVNDAYLKAQRRSLVAIGGCLALTLLLMAALFMLVLVLRRQKARLAEAGARQEEAARNVREASNIKNTYVTMLMLECIARIGRLEEYRKSLNRKAIAGEIHALQKELKSNAVVEREWASFYSVFDKTFLTIFPTFVSDFNALLLPENAVRQPAPGVLSPELRIYALIRLGLNSTDRISELLRYSKSTIYAYRSRTRLKAVSPASFEDDIMRISSI